MNEDPVLFSSPDEKPEFRPPDQYFESFTSRLHDRMNAGKKRTFTSSWALIPLAAAALWVVIVLVRPENDPNDLAFSEQQLIDQLLNDDYLSSIDGDLMADVFSEELAYLDIYQISEADSFLLDNLDVNELLYEYEI